MSIFIELLLSLRRTLSCLCPNLLPPHLLLWRCCTAYGILASQSGTDQALSSESRVPTIGLPGNSLKVKVTQLCPTLCDPHGLYSPWNSPGQDTGVGSLSLLQQIFPTQELNSSLLHCRWILYQLS